MAKHGETSPADDGYTKVTRHVISLANLGAPDEVGGLRAARFRPPVPFRGIDWILLRTIGEARQECTAITRYEDESSYSITWRDGDVWAIDHTDPAQAEGRDLDKVLPHSGGRRRIDYASNRFRGTILGFDLRDRVAPNLVTAEATERMVDKLVSDLQSEDERFANAWQKDIDPADMDMAAFCAPIMALRPQDRVRIYPPDFER